MNHLLRLIFSIALGAISYGVTRLLKAGTVISVFVGAVVACVSFMSSALDFTKKALEVKKLFHEIAALKRKAKADKTAESDKNKLVRPATPEETSTFGSSILERKLDIYRQVEEEKERLEANDFITRLREKKMK